MNAKALFELYGPLWEKVPETRPTRGERVLVPGRAITLDIFPCSSWHWGMPGGPTPVCCNVCEEDAENACRVAVEDWLLHHDQGKTPDRDVSLTAARTGKDGTNLYHIDCGSLPFEARFASDTCTDHPTLHHALVAVALAVAGVGK